MDRKLTSSTAVFYKVVRTSNRTDLARVGEIVFTIRDTHGLRTSNIFLQEWVRVPVALGVLEVNASDSSVRKSRPPNRVSVVG